MDEYDFDQMWYEGGSWLALRDSGWDSAPHHRSALTHPTNPDDWRPTKGDGGGPLAEYVGATSGWYQAPPCEPDTREGVYLIQASSGSVKVGYSKDAESRIKQLQTGNAEPLTLVDVLDLDQSGEKALHKRFARLRLHGEWFEPEILGLLDEYPRV